MPETKPALCRACHAGDCTAHRTGSRQDIQGCYERGRDFGRRLARGVYRGTLRRWITETRRDCADYRGRDRAYIDGQIAGIESRLSLWRLDND